MAAPLSQVKKITMVSDGTGEIGAGRITGEVTDPTVLFLVLEDANLRKFLRNFANSCEMLQVLKISCAEIQKMYCLSPCPKNIRVKMADILFGQHFARNFSKFSF